jgi:hypothetical protein
MLLNTRSEQQNNDIADCSRSAGGVNIGSSRACSSGRGIWTLDTDGDKGRSLMAAADNSPPTRRPNGDRLGFGCR